MKTSILKFYEVFRSSKLNDLNFIQDWTLATPSLCRTSLLAEKEINREIQQILGARLSEIKPREILRPFQVK